MMAPSVPGGVPDPLSITSTLGGPDGHKVALDIFFVLPFLPLFSINGFNSFSGELGKSILLT